MISFNFLESPERPVYLSRIKSIIFQAIHDAGKIPGEVNYIICSDTYLLEINQKFLRHDNFTDIVTFPTSASDEVVSGEIYISIDRVRENAKELDVDFLAELNRVAVHGVLHLLGYEDHTAEQKAEMRAKEDYYINLPPRANR
jgi:rRNA maturation RNase YbeY